MSARLFSVPQIGNEVKRTPLCGFAEIQEAVTDELKKVQKREIFGSFSETVRPRKSLYIYIYIYTYIYMSMELILK